MCIVHSKWPDINLILLITKSVSTFVWMAHLKPPDQLDFSRATTDWVPWKKQFDRYRIVSKLAKDSGDVQANTTILYALGPQREGVFLVFSFRGWFKEIWCCHYQVWQSLRTNKKCNTRTSDVQQTRSGEVKTKSVPKYKQYQKPRGGFRPVPLVPRNYSNFSKK